MGMYDSIQVKSPLPLTAELQELKINWSEEEFQTKDLENLLDQYEISAEGELRHMIEKREWVSEPDAFLGGHFKLLSQEWVTEPFHGIIRFYTHYSDKPDLRWDYTKGADQMSWEDLVQVEGYDWWIEFAAIFDSGKLREIRLIEVGKTLIRTHLASCKEYAEKREIKKNRPSEKIFSILRKPKPVQLALRHLYRWEQKLHEKTSRLLLKLGNE